MLTRPWSGPSVSVAGLEQAEDVRFDRHVGLHGDGATAAANDLVDHGVGRLALPVIVHAHGVAARPGHSRGGGADAATAARHDDRAGAAPRRSRLAARSVEREPEDAPVAGARQHRNELLAVQFVGDRRGDAGQHLVLPQRLAGHSI